MILTCPECATSYFVDDSRIKVGRQVKCSNCGARWVAATEAGTAAPAAPAPAAAPKPAPAPAPAKAYVVDDLVVEGPETAAEAAAAAKAAKAAKPAKPETSARREANGKVMIWAGSAAVIVALVAAALVFRDQVVRAWPASGKAYTSVGVPVNTLGLVIEDVRADPAFQGGRPVLSVTGRIRNIRDAAAVSPELKVSLLDKGGKALTTKLARPIDPNVPAHAVRHFAVAVVDPPAGMRDLEVTFGPAPKGGVKVPIASRAVVAPVAAPPPPVEDARALPPGSPDALAPHP
jgi:predicted Zn finger-like uncharacterized protein